MSDGAEDVIGALQATPGWLAAAFAAVGKASAEAAGVDGAWTLADIIGHLRASDAILAPRILHVLIRPGAPLVAYDERAWAELVAGVPIADQLTEFAQRRSELVGVLRSLSEGQWVLAGEHEVRGTMTVAQIVATIVEHEAEHRLQVEALVRTG